MMNGSNAQKWCLLLQSAKEEMDVTVKGVKRK